MVLEKLIVGGLYCNCYLVGSDRTKEIFIVDPGAEPDVIIQKVNMLNLKPVAIVLTHAHTDHTRALRKVRDEFNLPLYYSEKEYNLFIRIKADNWLSEGTILTIDDITFHVIETGGHSPGGICFYTKDIKGFQSVSYDGILFTGDTLFRRSMGDTHTDAGATMDDSLLCENIRNKILYNPELTDNYLILAGHMGLTTIGDEKRLNPFGQKFLTEQDWNKNDYYGKDIKKILKTPPEERP